MARAMGEEGAELATTLQTGVELLEANCQRMTLAVIQQDWNQLGNTAKDLLTALVLIIQGAATLASTEPLLAKLDEVRGEEPGEERG